MAQTAEQLLQEMEARAAAKRMAGPDMSSGRFGGFTAENKQAQELLKGPAERKLEEMEANLEVDRSDMNFFERYAEDLKNRFGEQGAEIIQARVMGEQGLSSTALQLTGKVGVGSILDFFGEALISGGRGLSTITPDFIEDPLKENATKAGLLFLDTGVGQAGVKKLLEGKQAWDEWSADNPVAARNIESVVNIGLFLAPVKGVKKTPVGRAGDAVRTSGRRSAVQSRREFVEELVTPKQTVKVMEGQVGRTAEVGRGALKANQVTLSPLQQQSAKAVARVSGVGAHHTLQGNYNIIKARVSRMADSLVKQLDDLGDAGRYNWTEFSRSLYDDVAVRLKQNPVLQGDAARAAEKVMEHALRLTVDGRPQTLGQLLRVRRELDRWVLKHKPKAFADGQAANAITTASREVRNHINKFIGERATTVNVRQSLRNQQSLLRAMDDIAPKAAMEGNSAIARGIQRAVQVIPIRNELIAAGSLMFMTGGLGAASLLAPWISKLALTGGLLYGTGRAIMHPNTRKGIGILLQNIDKGLAAGSSPAIKGGLLESKKELERLLEEMPEYEDDE